MSALMDALKRGNSIAGATVYVTAFPCHNCAKHMVALGLKVKYLEPYPKSRASAMYGPTVADNFLPFTGIAPLRYQQLFNVTDERKNPDGSRKSWSAADKRAAQPKVDALLYQTGIAMREASAVKDLPDAPEGAAGDRAAAPVEGTVRPAQDDQEESNDEESQAAVSIEHPRIAVQPGEDPAK